MLTVEQPPFLIGGGSMHCFRGGAPQAAVRKEGSLDFESAAFCDTTGHQNDREEEDGEGAVRRDEDFDDDFDDEDPVSPNWREEFESLMEEDKTRAAEKAAKKRLSEQEPTSTGPLKCLSVLNRLHCPFGSQEDEPPPKTPDPDRCSRLPQFPIHPTPYTANSPGCGVCMCLACPVSSSRGSTSRPDTPACLLVPRPRHPTPFPGS